MTELILFEKQLDVFVQQNNLLPADAILVKKSPLKLLKHYILYLGKYQLRHVFMAYTTKGVKVFSYQQLMIELETFIPEKIEKFIGTPDDRQDAVKRALQRKDEDSYHLILNNCEHFKNWVQKGIHKSDQVENIGKGAFAAGIAVTAASAGTKSKTGTYVGIGLMILGGLAWALSGDDSTKTQNK